jgi:hypothetical protein
MKKAVFWDVTSCGSWKNQSFRGMSHIITANFPSLLILSTLMMEVIVPWKHQFLQEPHSITSQEILFFNLCSAYWHPIDSIPLSSFSMSEDISCQQRNGIAK